jgi:sec-independent protein translocase protein TatC
MSDPKEMPFLDHLEELRWRVIWSVLAIVVGSAVGVVATIRFDLIQLLTAPLFAVVDELSGQDPAFLGLLSTQRLVFLNLTEPLFFVLRLGVMIGLVLASPVVVYQIWAFLAPALSDQERKAIVPTFLLGLMLFGTGVAMAYFVALPMTIRFLLLFGAEWFTPALTAGFYMSMVLRLLLVFGLAFELPVVLLVLSALGLVTSRFLRSKRRHAIVAMAVLGSVATPGDAVVVTLLLLGPMFFLFELGIVLCSIVERKRSADGTPTPEDSVPILGVLATATYSWRVSNKELLLSAEASGRLR